MIVHTTGMNNLKTETCSCSVGWNIKGLLLRVP